MTENRIQQFYTYETPKGGQVAKVKLSEMADRVVDFQKLYADCVTTHFKFTLNFQIGQDLAGYRANKELFERCFPLITIKYCREDSYTDYHVPIEAFQDLIAFLRTNQIDNRRIVFSSTFNFTGYNYDDYPERTFVSKKHNSLFLANLRETGQFAAIDWRLPTSELDEVGITKCRGIFKSLGLNFLERNLYVYRSKKDNKGYVSRKLHVDSTSDGKMSNE